MYKPEKILNDLLLYIWFCATGTMAISNCLFSPTLEIPAEFPTWCVLAKLSANPRNYS